MSRAFSAQFILRFRPQGSQLLECTLSKRSSCIIDATKSEVFPESGVGESIGYALNNWTALTRYVEIADVPLLNNSVERSPRVASW